MILTAWLFREFSRTWYTWLIATGVSMALTLSVKMVGLFLVAAIGLAVVLDLWGMMDFKRGLELVSYIEWMLGMNRSFLII